MSTFKVGDRVYCLCVTESGKEAGNQFGVVCDISKNYPPVGVRWDEERRWMHNCGGNCEARHGWYVFEEDLELVYCECPQDDCEIVMGDLL